MNSTEGVRRPFAIVAWLFLVLGLALLGASLWADSIELTARFAALGMATLVAENFALAMPGYSVSLTYPLLIALAVLCGPSATLVVALLIAVNLQEIRIRLPITVHAFNIGQLLISNGIAAWLYVLLGGRVLTDSSGIASQMGLGDFPDLLAPLAAMIAFGALGNFTLLAFGYSLKHDARLTTVLGELGWLPPVQVVLAGVGVMLAQIMAASAAALPLFVFPLFVARQFYQRFMALQDAYTDTLRSLVSGLEAKDPYTRGHSERVATYSVMLARQLDLEERQIAEIEAAALLHDLGKLTISGDILRKQSALSDQEWNSIKRHPEIGARMVARIPHLKRLAEAVETHHERLDGSGYPRGLVGEGITEAARILAIADSYDAMTTDRPYRRGLRPKEALDELRRCRGLQYDAGLVDSFIEAIADEGDALPIIARSAPLRSTSQQADVS